MALGSLLLPRFGELPLSSLGGKALAELDAELVAEGLEPSTRAKHPLRVPLGAGVRSGRRPPAGAAALPSPPQGGPPNRDRRRGDHPQVASPPGCTSLEPLRPLLELAANAKGSTWRVSRFTLAVTLLQARRSFGRATCDA